MKNNTNIFYLFLFIILNSSVGYSQIQKGTDINGEDPEDLFGECISMPDINTIAVGGRNNGGNGSFSGHVRVYKWNGSTWVQKGNDIDGEAAGDNSGNSVCMPDSNTLAVGAYLNDGNGLSSGHARIYTWNGSTWVQKGSDIDGEASGDQSGWAVSMPDANTIAVSSTYNDDAGSRAGHVRVFTWNGSTWVQKGVDIDGEAAGDKFGYSVSMPDANTICAGAINNDGSGSNAGHVRVFTWGGSSWIQKGIDINGEAADDQFGYSVSMPDANTIAAGANWNDGNGSNAGHVRVYTWNGSAWVQKGVDLDGEAVDDEFGYSVSMFDANTMVVGAPYNTNNINLGRVKVYNWNGSTWVQKGTNIDGSSAGGWFGYSVSMPDANTIGVGAPWNGVDAGVARVYDLSSINSLKENSTLFNVQVYPNPVSTILNIQSRENILHTVILMDISGRIVYQAKIKNTDQHVINVSNFKNGLYTIKLLSDSSEMSQLIDIQHE